ATVDGLVALGVKPAHGLANALVELRIVEGVGGGDEARGGHGFLVGHGTACPLVMKPCQHSAVCPGRRATMDGVSVNVSKVSPVRFHGLASGGPGSNGGSTNTNTRWSPHFGHAKLTPVRRPSSDVNRGSRS